MKRIFTIVFCLSFVLTLSAQQYHTSTNAVSTTNESNSTNGWNALANLQAVNDDSQDGNLSFMASSTATNDREISYALNAPVGTTLQISIWARFGTQNFRPAFANWTGFSGFSTTPITSANWTLYQWTLQVTNATQVIRVYTSPRTGGSEGDAVYIDGVSITGPEVLDTQPPTEPSGVTANTITENSFGLTWDPSTDDTGVTGYEVFIDGVSEGTTTVESFQLNALSPETTYQVTVVAFDAAGNSSTASAPLGVTTLPAPDTTAPSVPSGLVANTITETSFDLVWDPSIDDTGVTGYEVFLDGVSAGTAVGEGLAITGLTAGTTYQVTVTAADAAGNISAPSAPLEVITLTAVDTQAPSVPTDIVADGITEVSFNLNWTASTDDTGVAQYEVFIDGVSAGTTTTESFVVNGLTAGTTYQVTLTASDAAGNTSEASIPIEVSTLAASGDIEAPSVPSGLVTSTITQNSFSLSWDPSTDNTGVTGYEVFLDGVSAGTSDVENFQFDGLLPATLYTVTISARDAAGNISATSTPLEVTTLEAIDTEAPSVPEGLSAGGITTTSFSLSWNPSTDDTGVTLYEVFLNGISAGTSTIESLELNALDAGTTYQVTVTASDAAGNTSAASAPLEVTTLSAGDTQPPGAVTDLAFSNVTSNSVSLTWTNPGDDTGVVNYELFVNNNVQGFTGAVQTFTLSGLTPETGYTIALRAYDDAGNIGELSNTVSFNTLPVTPGITAYTTANANLPEVDWQANNLFVNGSLGVGAAPSSGYRLAVAGNIISEEVRVALQQDWPDYVFKDDYNLPNLSEVKKFIQTYGHLPEVPSQEEVKAQGILLGNMNATLLRKIEELTLYILEQQSEIDKLKEAHRSKEQELIRRIERLEKKLLEEDHE